MNKSKIKFSILLLMVLILCFCGCSRYKQVKPVSFGVESVVPHGFRKANVYISVEVDNPASSIMLSDIGGSVVHSGTIIGNFTVDPVILKAKTLGEYSVRLELTLAEGVSILNIMALANEKGIKECTADVQAKVTLKNGISKKLKYEGIPLSNFVNF